MPINNPVKDRNHSNRTSENNHNNRINLNNRYACPARTCVDFGDQPCGKGGSSLAGTWLVPHGSVPAPTGLTPLDEQNQSRPSAFPLSNPKVKPEPRAKAPLIGQLVATPDFSEERRKELPNPPGQPSPFIKP